MRIMMGKILQTNNDTSSKDNATRNIFWDLIVKYAKLYQNIARSLTWNIMNSSIRSYVSYLVIAFIFVIVFVTLTN
jgi:hypothetical protein